MDKLAYHLNKKKKLAKTEGKFLYYYPCDAEDNPNVWFGPKAYIVIEVGEKEWEALFELDRLEYNNTHKYNVTQIVFLISMKTSLHPGNSNAELIKMFLLTFL